MTDICRFTRRHLAAIAPYEPGKPPEELERELGIASAIKLASNENPLGPSPLALEAAHAALSQAHRYADSNVHALRSALARQLAVDPNELAFGHGSNELIDLLCRTFAGPDDHAVLGAPSFVCYRLSLLAAQVPITEVPLDQGVYWNVDRMLAAVKPNTRFVFVDNPNNPTSTHVPRPALERLLRSLGPNVIPVIDEAYLHFADAPDYASALMLRELHPNLVVLRTFSKAYGLAALRAGYAVGPAWLLRDLERVRVPFNVNGVAQVAALAALDDHALVARVVAHNREQRALLQSELALLGLHVAPSQANFLCVELPAGTRLDASAAYDALLRKGVIVRPIGGLPRHLRISIGLADENARLISALRDVLA
jgi:histidinol-phosphate aminotransferase